MFLSQLFGGDEKKIRKILVEYKKVRSNDLDSSEDEICRKIIANRFIRTGRLRQQNAEGIVASVFKKPVTIEKACSHIVIMENPEKFGLSETVSMHMDEISRRRKDLHKKIDWMKLEIIGNNSKDNKSQV